MKMKNTGAALSLALLAGAGVLSAAPAHAGTTTYALPDIGSFPYRTLNDLNATFAGNGFVENYGGSQAGINEFAHDFGVNYDYDKVNVQVDISGLAGQKINSANLSFDFLDVSQYGNGLGKTVDVVQYQDLDGKIGYTFYNTPTTLGQTSFHAYNGANSVDLTQLLQQAVANHEQYFALQLSTPDDHTEYLHTDDYPNNTLDADRPNLRLTVNSVPAVPEPSSYVALVAGLFSLAGFAMRRRRAE